MTFMTLKNENTSNFTCLDDLEEQQVHFNPDTAKTFSKIFKVFFILHQK